MLDGAGRLVHGSATRPTSSHCACRAGLIRPELPHRLAQQLAGVRTLRDARRRDRDGRDSQRGPRRADRRSRRAHLQAARRALERGRERLARARPTSRATASRSSPATTAASSTRRSPRPSAAPGSCCSTPTSPGPQIREVAGREGTDLLVYDDEYADMLEGVDPPRGRFRAWADDEPAADTLEALIGSGSPNGARRSPA